MISSLLSSQLSVLRVRFSVWADQRKVEVFSSMMLRDCAGLRVDLDEAEPLMPAVHLRVSEVSAVGPPADPRRAEVDPIEFGPDLLGGGHVEEVQLVGVELVAGQLIGATLEPGPAASRGRRLDEMDFLVLARLDPERDQYLGIGRPRKPRVSKPFLAVVAESDLLAIRFGSGEQVVIPDQCGPLAIRRADPIASPLLAFASITPLRQ